MHSQTIILALLALTSTEALPLTGILAPYICNNACIHASLLPPAKSTETVQIPSMTNTPPNPTLSQIGGFPTPALTPSLSIPILRSPFRTTRYTNTGDPVSVFLRARQTSTALTAEHEEVHVTSEPDFVSLDITISLRAVLVKTNGSVVGNGIEASDDLSEETAFDGESDRGVTSIRQLAREPGFVGGGNGNPWVPARHAVGGGNSIPPQVARDLGSVGGGSGIPPILARYVFGGGNGIPQLADDSSSAEIED